jgi:CxxC-x17-CxxC domain-containing protein
MVFPKRNRKDRKDRKESRPEGDRRRVFSRGTDRNQEKTLTNVTCDSCGKSCTVPLIPTAGKPVYCSDCFRKDEPGSRSERPYNPRRSQNSANNFSEKASSSNNRDLVQINRKLDKILDMLEGGV